MFEGTFTYDYINGAGVYAILNYLPYEKLDKKNMFRVRHLVMDLSSEPSADEKFKAL